jgi:hypothetical protein
MRITRLLIVLIIIAHTCNSKNQTDVDMNTDTLKTQSEFQHLTDSLFSTVERPNHELTDSEAITLAKAYNTIASYSLSSSEPFRSYFQKLDGKYMQKITKILDCEISIGMGYFWKNMT